MIRGPLALLAVVGPGEPGAVSFGAVGLILHAETAREATDPAKRHRRICAAALRGPVLPARRGARFSDLAAARAWAEARADALSAALSQMVGRAEFVVTLAGDAPSPPRAAARDAAHAPGAAYLRARAAERPAPARAAETARARLAALAADLAAAHPELIEARRLLADPARGMADLSLLAPRDAGPALAETVAAQAAQAAFSGPWPPYSFAELAA